LRYRSAASIHKGHLYSPNVGQRVATVLEVPTVVLLQVADGPLLGLHLAGGQQLRVAGVRGGEGGGRRRGQPVVGGDADAAAVLGAILGGGAAGGAAGGQGLVRVAADDSGGRRGAARRSDGCKDDARPAGLVRLAEL